MLSTQTSARIRMSLISWSTIALLTMSAGLNVVLAARLRSQSSAARQNATHIGQKVIPIMALDDAGATVAIRFDRNMPTVLYYFSPTCPWCEKNLANINAIAANANGRYRVVGLAAEPSLADYRRTHDLQFETFGGVSAEAREALGLTATPRTVVVSAQSLVTHEWTGAFTGPNARPVEDLFGIPLPGLPAPAKPSSH